MAKKSRKFSKQHLANLRAAHAARRGKKRNKKTISVQQLLNQQLSERIKPWTIEQADEKLLATHKKPIEIPVLGLAERFKLAVDAIEEQIKRLETIVVSA
jgi:hypothetical protein